jgi:hypothetical protein
MRIGVIVPEEVAQALDDLGWGSSVAPMSGRHVLVTIEPDQDRRWRETEALVLSAYGYAMS